MITLFDALRNLAAQAGSFNNVFLGFVYLMAVLLAANLANRIYKFGLDTLNSDITAMSLFTQFIVVGLLAAFTVTLELAGGTVWGRASMVAYKLPAGSDSAELAFKSTLIALAIILRVFGSIWGAHALLTLNQLGRGRGGRGDIGPGGVALQIGAAAALVNIVWVVSLIQSSIKVSPTLMEYLQL